MSTGDLNGNVARLLRELKAIKYPSDVDEVGLRLGDPVAFLPLLSFSLLKFSRHVARYIVRNGFELAGKTDHRFIESSFKLFRDLLNVRTVLTPAQFFEQGYAERKVLLLCDVIAVCKKLHNEEVRQERLAALKATRQEHAGSRLSTPAPRKSPIVKVVRNDDVEVHQVLAPQHLPNASDGAQSVYKTTKTVAKARSPSPSPSGPSAAGKTGLRPRSPLGPQLAARGGGTMELTFRPAAAAQAGHAAGPAAARTGAAAAQQQAPLRGGPAPRAGQPIRAWFMNPAFDGSEEEGAGVELGLGSSFGFGETGRPDSSAWWQSGPFPTGQQTWQQPASTVVHGSAAAEGSPVRTGGRVASGHASGGAVNTQPRSSGQAPTTATAPAPGLRQPARNPFLAGMPAASVFSRGNGAAAAAAVPSDGGVAVPGSAAFARRELDEWSFSKFFGPGKVAQQSRGRGTCEDGDSDDGRSLDAANHDGEIMEPGAQLSTEGQAGAGAAEAADAADWVQRGQHGGGVLDRDGPAPDQDRRNAPPQASFAIGARSSADTGQASDRPPQAPGLRQHSGARLHQASAGPHGHAAAAEAGSISVEAELRAKLEQLESETQSQLRQLRERLVAAEEELEKCRSEARQSRDALQAQVTVLEGRVRFLECELEVCVKRQPGTELPGQRSPGSHVASPAASAGLNVAALQSPERPRSAGPALQAAASGAGAGSLSRTSGAAPSQPESTRTMPTQLAPGTYAAGTQTLGQSQASGQGQAASNSQMQGPSTQAWSRPATSGLAAGAAIASSSAIGATAGGGQAAPQAGNAALHIRPSFSPMPQPSFSFQPRNLMEQVASASTGGAPSAQAHLVPPNGPLVDPGSRPFGGSMGSLPASGDTGSGSAAGGQTRASLDSALQAQAPAVPSGGPTLAGHGAGSQPLYGPPNPSWRVSDRLGARGIGAGSILDGVGNARVPQSQGYDQPYNHATLGGVQQSQPESARALQGSVTLPSSAGGVPSAAGAVGASGATETAAHSHTTAYTTPGGQAGGGSVAPGPGTGGSAGGFRSTDDLINSLYMRYTEAQDFLQTIRRR